MAVCMIMSHSRSTNCYNAHVTNYYLPISSVPGPNRKLVEGLEVIKACSLIVSLV